MAEGRVRTREINQGIRYTCWAVFGRTGPASEGLVEALTSAQEGWDDVVVRGWYDVSGLRAGSDIMVWLHGPTAEGLQAALRDIRRALGAVEQTWSAFALHRPAEFNKGHVPAFLAVQSNSNMTEGGQARATTRCRQCCEPLAGELEHCLLCLTGLGINARRILTFAGRTSIGTS